LLELAEVLGRAKFDPYLTIGERQDFLRMFDRIAERVEVVRTVQACRDPRDDKFLELAVEGEADVIVTGDNDLLTLDPFQGISILTPARFLQA
jgi:putative PIN family toxin of toxin-antitoxin system